MTDKHPVRRALISVSDKMGLVEFASALSGRGIELVSTGGTARTLRAEGLSVTEVSDLTGFPEMMDGRVKTLHPAIHGGLLALRDKPLHAVDMKAHGIGPIDLLVVNLYPFEETVASGADPDEIIENIDIGGPAMIRAGAKNHRFVSVVVDTADYTALLAELDAHDGCTTLRFRTRVAQIAYARTAAYDAAVSNWMALQTQEKFPRRRVFGGHLVQNLRYGENPHQAAAFYAGEFAEPGLATATQHQGKELSYNNINDTDAAFRLVSEFAPELAPACAIVKHANPCGVAQGETLAEAFTRAFDCDRTSAFGGIVALNRTLDGETARAIIRNFTEVVIAPEVSDDAMEVFSNKKNLRLLTTGGLSRGIASDPSVRQVSGGWLVQDEDKALIERKDLKTVTRKTPTNSELDDLLFAWTVAKHVKSNAIVYAKGGRTVGIGAGQMSRVDSSTIAALKAARMGSELGMDKSPAIGSVVASDAFFPFPDGLLAAAEAGATAVIQPGGSVRDDEVIAAADEAGLAMVFTGTRHFRH